MVLNQSYEPLSICTVRKALILLLLGKAEMVSADESRPIRSKTSAFPKPNVIRLRRYVTVPYKQVILTRRNVLKRDGYKCVYCGRADIALTVDHVIPKVHGGKDSWENMVCACTKCNNKKGSRTLAEVGMRMIHKPFEPNHILFIKNSVSKVDESWKPYLFFH